jgi:hypothetical protein
MRKEIFGMTAVLLVIALMGCAQMGGKGGEQEGLSGSPVLAVSTAMAPMDSKGSVQLMGAGFEPGQKLNILFSGKEGSLSNVSWAIKPEPVPNAQGTWSTTFTYGRYVSRKRVKPGEAYIIIVTDADYNFLCQAPIGFYAK